MNLRKCPHGWHAWHTDRANFCLGSQFDAKDVAEWREHVTKNVERLGGWLS
jgi:hypothetical protein